MKTFGTATNDFVCDDNLYIKSLDSNLNSWTHLCLFLFSFLTCIYYLFLIWISVLVSVESILTTLFYLSCPFLIPLYKALGPMWSFFNRFVLLTNEVQPWTACCCSLQSQFPCSWTVEGVAGTDVTSTLPRPTSVLALLLSPPPLRKTIHLSLIKTLRHSSIMPSTGLPVIKREKRNDTSSSCAAVIHWWF